MQKKSSMLVFFICFLLGVLFFINKNNSIVIKNNSGVDLSGIQIKYNYASSHSYVDIPLIKNGSAYSFKITWPKKFNEGSISLVYTDKEGVEHENLLVGYVEKGYSLVVRVIVNAMDGNGILSINSGVSR